MPAAKGFVISIDDAGTYINPADSALWMDWQVTVQFVGADHRIVRRQIRVQLDPTTTGAAMQAAIAQAVRDLATSKGYTIAANDVFLLSFARA
jgi:hypothetical protein